MSWSGSPPGPDGVAARAPFRLDRRTVGRAGALVELTKPRITALVLVTTAVGFYVASPGVPALGTLLHALLGTALTAGGTNALNQYLERSADGVMRRTRGRPLPSGRIGSRTALGYALGISIAGVAYLVVFVNTLTAALGAFTLLSYVAIYTPLKKRTTHCTLVGAVPGALPIVGGWTAATGELSSGAAALFAILFLWQMPHFLGLGWVCRSDYARAGFRILATQDRDGTRTARQCLAYLLLLVPASAVPVALGLAGTVYLALALAAGLAFLSSGIRLARRPSPESARRLFAASVLYLPALLLFMVIDKV